MSNKELIKARRDLNRKIIETTLVSSKRQQEKVNHAHVVADREMKSELKLVIELIPSTSVGWNLHSSQVHCLYKEWADLAKERVDAAGCKCEICGTRGYYYYICGDCKPEDWYRDCKPKIWQEWARLSGIRPDRLYKYKCAFCADKGGFYKQKLYSLECHERWSYDDTIHVQKLIGFIVLCKLCHL